jgi:hypothetical protein
MIYNYCFSGSNILQMTSPEDQSYVFIKNSMQTNNSF